MNCQNCQNELEEMVLNPASSPSAEVKAHMDGCEPCRKELAELRATFALMDEWKAPEPSAWFDTRLAARVREAQAEPAGLLERLRYRLLYNTGSQFRPLMAGALALVILVGGASTYISQSKDTPPHAAAVVNDLQILDRNDQAIQEIDLLDDNSPDDGVSQI